MTLITLVESNVEDRKRFTGILHAGGFDVVDVSGGLEGLRSAFEQRPGAVIVDLSAGDIDSFELTKILRAACDTPILITATNASPGDIVRALDAGADDVISKDCVATEFLARLRAAIRRYQQREPSRSVAQQAATGALAIDREAQIVTKHGKLVPLTRTEYRLLDALAARMGETVPHRYLLSTVWGDQFVDDTHYLRVYIGYLRNKLEDDPAQPAYFTNDWGVGYRLARLPIVDAVPDEQVGLSHLATA